jgi:hypothetical protein
MYGMLDYEIFFGPRELSPDAFLQIIEYIGYFRTQLCTEDVELILLSLYQDMSHTYHTQQSSGYSASC